MDDEGPSTFRPAAPEPWHYRAIERSAWACIALAIGQAAVCLMLVVSALVGGREGGSPAEAVGRVPYSLGALVGTFLLAAPTLLAVGVARDVRAIRRAVDEVRSR